MKSLSTANKKADRLHWQVNRLTTVNWLHNEIDRYEKKVVELRKKLQILDNSSGDADVIVSGGKFNMKVDQLHEQIQSMLDKCEQELENATNAFLKVSIEFNGAVIEA